MSPIEGASYTSLGAPSESELASQYWDRIRVLAARRLGDAAAAEDVAQETLRRVVTALREGRVENLTALPAFVFQTARHICLQQQRSAGREIRALTRVGAGSGPSNDDALAALISEERRVLVRRALEGLGDTDRELLRLAYFEELGTEELAHRLGTTAGAVRVRKHRALRRLSELLEGNKSPAAGT
jgi:RNA polymerase sigma-70 factor (ECF subfamily)